jgi:hypothetical protein
MSIVLRPKQSLLIVYSVTKFRMQDKKQFFYRTTGILILSIPYQKILKAKKAYKKFKGSNNVKA